MRTACFRSCAALVAMCVLPAMAAEQPRPLDLRRGVPADVFLAVHGRHNPERDFQRQYYQDVWNTVQETGIIERAVKIVTSRVSEENLEKAKSLLDELREAVAPVDVKTLLNASDVVYAQRMEFPQAQHLLLLRVTPEAAASSAEGVKNLFGLVEKYAKGKVSVETSQEKDAVVTTLSCPPGVPFRPTVAHVGDVLLLSSSDDFARQSLGMLLGGEGKCKFDDPRLKEALSRLPKPEDSLVFYDGKLQFSQLRVIGSFIRQQGAGDPNAERVAGLVELLIDNLAIFDYEVAVEYTEGNHNRSVAFGKLVPDFKEKMLGEVLTGGQPFESWQTWVPADATSYWLTTGISLHPAYERILAVIKERIPEAKPALERFEEIQSEHDLYLDNDLFQAFSGELVSVALPATTVSPLGGQDSVLALRCHKPERIRALLHRLFDAVAKQPFAQAQQLKLTECKELEGFEQVSALLLNLVGAKPVIGFREGWMFVGSNAQAVQRVFDTKAGKAPNVADTEAFKKLNLPVEGPVYSIQYTNLAEDTRNMAKFIGQVGMIAPVVIGLAGAEADSESLKPVQEVLALLPSVAKIVAKFDFLEARISVIQEGDEPASYLRRTVTVVRPKAEAKPEAEAKPSTGPAQGNRE